MIHQTISSHYVNVLCKKLDLAKPEKSQLLSRCGIPIAVLSTPQSRVSIDSFSLLLKRAQNHMQDEGIGYYLNPQKMGTTDVLIGCMSTADTVGEALNNAALFYDILDLGIKLTVHTEGDQCKLRMISDRKIHNHWVYEEVLTKIHRIVRWLSNEYIKLLNVSMPFEPVDHSNEYRLLFGSQFEFNAPYAELTFSQEQVDIPLRRKKNEIKTLSGEFRYKILSMTVDPKSYTERVRVAIKDTLPESFSYESIADQLSIHSQTLRRRLHDEGTEFTVIKNDIIRDLAIQYISSQELSIKQIAFLLNFSAPSSFNRAFKKWTGMSPAAFQKSIVQDPKNYSPRK